MSEWWQDHANVVAVAEWANEVGEITTASEAIAFFEKPWHYPEWWAEYQRADQ